MLTADQTCSDSFGSSGTLASEQGEPCGVSGATSPGAHACLCISRDWPGFWSPAGEKALINSRVGSPVQSVGATTGPRVRLPGPGGGSEGRRLPAAPGRSAPAARGARWLLIRAQAEVFRKTQRLQSPLGRHCALRGDQESVAKSYSVGSRSPPWPSLGGSPVTRPPPTHYRSFFSQGRAVGRQRRRLTFRTTRSSAKWRGPAQGGGRFQVLSEIVVQGFPWRATT